MAGEKRSTRGPSSQTPASAIDLLGPNTIMGGRLGGPLWRAEEWLVAAAMAAGLFFFGFDSASGRAIAFLVNAGVLAILIGSHPPSDAFWKAILPVVGLIGAAIAWLCIGMLASGVSPLAPDLAVIDLLGIGGGVCALLTGAVIGYNRGQTVKIIDIWLWLAVLSFALGAADSFSEFAASRSEHWRSGRFVGLIDNANVAAAASGAAFLLATARLLDGLRNRRNLSKAGLGLRITVLMAIMLAAGWTLLSCGSRAAIVLTIALLSALLVRGVQIGAQRGPVLAVLPLALALGAFLVAEQGGIVAGRIDRLDADSALRWAEWTRYLDAGLVQPLFGYGPGSFSSLSTALLADPLSATASWTVNSPHNVIFQLLLKGGIPYAALILLTAGIVAWDVAGYFRRARRSVTAWGLTAAVILIVGMSMVDIALDIPATITLAMGLGGLIWGEALVSRLPQPARAT